MNKKKLGIIGGMGSRAGAHFLRKVVDYSPAETDQDFLEIIFHNNSSVPDRTRAIVFNERSPLDDMLQSVRLFNENKVEVIAISCITAYYYYEQLCRHTTARVLNPLCIAAQNIRECFPETSRVGLLATTGTIKTGLFHKELEGINVETVTLGVKSQEELFMRSVYMKNGFKSAVVSQEASALMELAIRQLVERGVDLIIGGCTEVSIAVDPDRIRVPYLDVLDLLAKRTVDYCYGN